MYTLPAVTGNDRVELRFWQWYSYESDAGGSVQISVWDGSAWGDWVTLATPAPGRASSDWAPINVDVTSYSGQQIRLGFYHTHGSYLYRSSGWYIDDIELTTY